MALLRPERGSEVNYKNSLCGCASRENKCFLNDAGPVNSFPFPRV